MIRNLKAFGLALGALLAMGALSASAASATDLITTGTPTALLTGTSHDNKFVAGGLGFECTTSKFTGTAENGGDEVTVLPSYTGVINETPHTNPKCTAAIGKVTVKVNDCHYVLTGETTGSDNGTDATVWITCPNGTAGIVIEGPLGCIITVPPQTPTSGGVTYENLSDHTKSGEASGEAVKITATSTGITYTATNACTLVGINEHGNDATYKGTLDATAYEDVASSNELTTITEGDRVNVTMS